MQVLIWGLKCFTELAQMHAGKCESLLQDSTNRMRNLHQTEFYFCDVIL